MPFQFLLDSASSVAVSCECLASRRNSVLKKMGRGARENGEWEKRNGVVMSKRTGTSMEQRLLPAPQCWGRRADDVGRGAVLFPLSSLR